MERDYDYKGFRIRVRTETVPEPASATRGVLTRDRGYLAVIDLYKAGATVPHYPEFQLIDHDDRWFVTEVDALMGGFSAGRRIVDDELASHAA